jgi:phosphoribosylformylglycinamidine cyclo-ligase
VPTRIYVPQLLPLLRDPATGGHIKALAHITGGGLLDNLPRVLGPGLAIDLDLSAWELPPVFSWLAERARLDTHEMLKTSNCGIGMCVIVDALECQTMMAALTAIDEEPVVIGKVVESS